MDSYNKMGNNTEVNSSEKKLAPTVQALVLAIPLTASSVLSGCVATAPILNDNVQSMEVQRRNAYLMNQSEELIGLDKLRTFMLATGTTAENFWEKVEHFQKNERKWEKLKVDKIVGPKTFIALMESGNWYNAESDPIAKEVITSYFAEKKAEEDIRYLIEEGNKNYEQWLESKKNIKNNENDINKIKNYTNDRDTLDVTNADNMKVTIIEEPNKTY